MTGEIMEHTTQAIVQEIESSPIAGRPAKTIFFGGGTPTFLSSDQLLRVLQAVLRSHPPVPDCEITSEANPGTVDSEKFEAMVAGGFNRVSLGAQSFESKDLLRLGRVHRADDIALAVRRARAAGFANLNLDLMFALPGQSLNAWCENVKRALDLGPNHLSLYCLTLEPNTPFYKQYLRGELVQPDEEQQLAMFDKCLELCEAAGLSGYEISNFAEVGKQCEHNLCYWRSEEYAGYGPGAVGAVALGSGPRRRGTNIKHPVHYCEAVSSGAPLHFESEELSAEALELERVMLGLRLAEGISTKGMDRQKIDRVLNAGWIEESENRISLTAKGRHLCNQAIAELV